MHELSAKSHGPFDSLNFTCRWNKLSPSSGITEKIAICTSKGLFAFDSSKSFSEIAKFDADYVETFDWCPTSDEIAVSSSNTIRILDGDDISREIQIYNNVFDVENADGMCFG